MACTHTAISTLTAQDFKDQFTRGFQYLPTWLVGSTYNAGVIVYYDINDLFYRCTVNGTIGIVPTDTNNWEIIIDERVNYILDGDIVNAYQEACISYSPSLFGADDAVKLSYLYLTAHYLVHDLRSNGLESAASHPLASQSVGSVSASYSIPEYILKTPIYSFYATSGYGLKYLNFLLPAMAGNVCAISGGTNA